LGGVARNPVGTLIGIATALGAFEGDYETDAFSHDLTNKCVNAVFDYYIPGAAFEKGLKLNAKLNAPLNAAIWLMLYADQTNHSKE
jgi:hypothetical protein